MQCSQVQPGVIDVAARNADAIKWAMTHWTEAETLAITVRGLDEQELENLDSGMQMLQDLIYATHYRWGVNQGYGMQLPRALRSVALHVQLRSKCRDCTHYFVYALLSELRPEVLCLAWDQRLTIPPMKSLKHLRLEVQNPRDVFHDRWEQCPNLESLSICSDEDPEAMALSVRFFKMDLAATPKLRRLTLQLLVPGQLSVPAGCKVHLVYHDATLVSEAWDKGLADVCTSCELFEQMPGVQSQIDGSPMLSCLQNMTLAICPQLAVLKLHCKQLGSEEDPFFVGVNLPSLQHLEVTADTDISLSFGLNIQLRILTTLSGAGLFLDFNDMWGFSRRLQSFSYRYKECCQMSLMWIWQLLQDEIHPMVWRLDWKDRSTPAEFVALDEKNRIIGEEVCGRECECGLCVDCVRRLHMPSSGHPMWPFVGLFD